MEDCIFCKIIRGEVPSKLIYEDEEVYAFEDIKPVAPIHVLVIPKKHIESLAKMNSEDTVVIAKIYEAINKIAEKLNIKEKGFRVVVNCGEDGGQVVKHLHFHILAGKKLGAKIV